MPCTRPHKDRHKEAQPEPCLGQEGKLRGSRQVPETHKGSAQWRKGLCSGMRSQPEKPSSSQRQRCPQSRGSQAPGPQSSHCLPVGFILESLPRDPPPSEPARWRGQSQASYPPHGHLPHTEPLALDTLEGREAGESNQGKEKEEEKANRRTQTSRIPQPGPGWVSRLGSSSSGCREQTMGQTGGSGAQPGGQSRTAPRGPGPPPPAP